MMGKCNVYVDVTKSPYDCDPTGAEDCTEALCRAFDDILRPNIEGIQKALKKLEESDDPDYRISFEICKKNGIPNVVFPEELSPAKILYFPKGTYLISDTISHHLENLKNLYFGKPTMEINRQIYLMGESREETVIKLQDNCKGFGFGNQKPMISYIQTEKSNIAQTNMIANLTVDCGKGNCGAVGLLFHSSNSGAVRNITIRSSDGEGRGFCGLLIDRATECYIKDLEVMGFDYGLKIGGNKHPVVCENIKVKNQRVTGFHVVNGNVPVIDFKSENQVTAFRAEGTESFVALLNAECLGGSVTNGVVIFSGEGYVRNLRVKGYWRPFVVGTYGYDQTFIEEFSTAKKKYNLFPADCLSLNLPIECAPSVEESFEESETAYVEDYGAVGDGVHDASDAICRAMNSGKPYVCFGQGHYLVNSTVEVPRTVKAVDFSYCDFYAGDALKNAENHGFLRIVGESETPLLLRNVFSWEKFYGKFRFIEHASRRTLILRDLHTQCAGMYFNSVQGGKVYIENCACTMGGDEYCRVIPFEFHGQKVWCRNINPERGDVQILNDATDLWILGMKTETHVGRFASTAIQNINGGRVECFGVNSGIGGKNIPLYVNDHSDMSVYFCCGGFSDEMAWDILVREMQREEVKELHFEDAQELTWYSCRVPGYVGVRQLER